MQKICSKCGIEKDTSEFYKDRSQSNGLRSSCKECEAQRQRRHRATHKYEESQRQKEYRRTFSGWFVRLWNNINQRTIGGKHPDWKSQGNKRYLEKGIRLEVTREQLFTLVTRHRTQIEAWLQAGISVSIDRKDSNRHYSLGNIRFIPTIENCRRGGVNGGLATAAKRKAAKILYARAKLGSREGH